MKKSKIEGGDIIMAAKKPAPKKAPVKKAPAKKKK